jgi:Ca2+-transporting ATPase
MEIDRVIDRLNTCPDNGLTNDRARERIEKHGRNELETAPPKPAWLKFLLQFNQPLLYILLGAGATKAILGEWVNAGVIWGVTTTNALIGFIQESKAEGAISALANAVTTEATVIRDGEKTRVPSGDLVPGDVVVLTSGDKVPADIRLFKARDLQVNESALTGESVAVAKNTGLCDAFAPIGDRHNMAHASGFVTFGQGTGIVVATGKDTEMGKISRLIEESHGISTPLTRKFDKFTKKWLSIVLCLAGVTFAVGLRSRGINDALEAAVALIVGAIPEGLPAVVTITLAIGVKRMARRNAIIRKLPAVETLGSATVICSDKTGTLTENQMTVQEIHAGDRDYHVTGNGYEPTGKISRDRNPIEISDETALEECLLAGLLCNDSRLDNEGARWTVIGDPTEGALLASAMKGGFDPATVNRHLPRLDSIPFESDYQYMATLHGGTDERVIYLKGSVEAILSRCRSYQTVIGSYRDINDYETVILHRVKKMADRGLRVLAFAKLPVSVHQSSIEREDIREGLIFLGLQGMIDPPRPSAVRAVQACSKAGIQVKMITGDHIDTARAIARRMGIEKDGQTIAYTGASLAAMDSLALADAVDRGSVFARVAPEQKLRIVEALQSRGEVVAMTGDGVNDAPALKQADIGIAMGITSTEVAKEAADMILTDDNFASIESAVEEGRSVYQNLLKAIAFILPVNGGESMTILISTLLARDLPILSLQILWINMLNTIAMTTPLAFEPKSLRSMERPPRDPKEGLLSGSRIKRILMISLFNWLLIFGVFEYIRATTGDLAIARTMTINALISGRIFYMLSISQLIPNLVGRFRGEIPMGAKIPAIAFGIVGAILLQAIFAHVPVINQLFYTAPLNASQWLFCLAAGSPMIFWAMLANRVDPLER